MKAWIVTEDCEGSAVIVFHNHGLAARRLGADELDKEFEYVECSRASQYDGYFKDGFVPPKVLIENGWRFECCQCGVLIDQDGYDYERERALPLDEVVEHGTNSVYCNQRCKDDRDKEKAERNELFEKFKKTVNEKRPDLDFQSFTGGWPYITMTAKFKFEGCKYDGSVRDDDGELTWFIANGDQEAWDKYELKRKGE